MKKFILMIVSLLLISLVFCSCEKKKLQDEITKLGSEIGSAIAGSSEGLVSETLAVLDEQLEKASERLQSSEKLGEKEMNEINELIKSVESNVGDILSGKTSEAELLLDKYTRIANSYSSIASELVGSDVATNGGISSIGSKVTDIATTIVRSGENISQEDIDKISKDLDEIQEQLNEIKNSK